MSNFVFQTVNDGLLLVFNNVPYKMIMISGGPFLSGTWDNEQEDYIENDFFLGEIPVTNELYYSVLGGKYNIRDSRKPITNVPHSGLFHFIEELNRITHIQFRLPTSKEWEYAAKGGAKSKHYKFAGSDNIQEVASVHLYNSTPGSNPLKDEKQQVKLFKPNELGLYDMTGNIAEISSDLEEKTETGEKFYITKGGAFYWRHLYQFDPGLNTHYRVINEEKGDRGVGIRLAL